MWLFGLQACCNKTAHWQPGRVSLHFPPKPSKITTIRHFTLKIALDYLRENDAEVTLKEATECYKRYKWYFGYRSCALHVIPPGCDAKKGFVPSKVTQKFIFGPLNTLPPEKFTEKMMMKRPYKIPKEY